MAKKLIKWAKETGVSTLAIPAEVGQCRHWERALLGAFSVITNLRMELRFKL